MKALILAAGFGTRLAPYTDTIPKALFPVAGTPVLGRMIAHLKRAGCTAIAVNAHHLADQIRRYLAATDFGLPVTLSHETQILGTGGAIRRLAGYWDDRPFLVVNADVLCDIDLGRVYRQHCDAHAPVTLVLHDRPPFNQVWVDGTDRIAGFERFADASAPVRHRRLAFTGIHVMDAGVLRWIPADGFSDIIAVYRRMIDDGLPLRAQVVEGHYWQDMGSPERFREAVVDAMAPQAFRSAFPGHRGGPVRCRPLSGDGSDRGWFRLTDGRRRLILADHGITPVLAGSEVDAFVRIGTHLHACGLPVPRIHAHDGFSGLVFVDDLGDCHLQEAVDRAPDEADVERRYQQAIGIWLDLTTRAAAGFDPDWTCQSRAYDVPLILDKECRYFVEAFANGYLNLAVDYEALADEFVRLAECAVARGLAGLIHRDFQSRNILIHEDRPFLIDFQGARHGPIQYDLASLLIDPYVGLDRRLGERLLAEASDRAARRFACSADAFVQGYRYCAVTRNLQMLGAFGYLSRVKRKPAFETWIPAAAAMLAENIRLAGAGAFPKLTALAEQVGGQLPGDGFAHRRPISSNRLDERR